MTGPLSEPPDHAQDETAGDGDAGRRTPAFAAYAELPDAVLVADSAGTVVYANPAAGDLLAVPVADLEGADLRRALPLRDGTDRNWWDLVEPYGGLRTRTRIPERLLVLDAGPRA
ncbi:MAG: PAS domain-containing protein, partial [Actinomycetota bacterium]|nr:PAS domain-containing protein [Actinomycetota bacterium]